MSKIQNKYYFFLKLMQCECFKEKSLFGAETSFSLVKLWGSIYALVSEIIGISI